MATGEGTIEGEEKSFWKRLITPVTEKELSYDEEANFRESGQMNRGDGDTDGLIEPGSRSESWYSNKEEQIKANNQMTRENRRRLVRLDERTAAQMKIFMLFLGSLGLAAVIFSVSQLGV